MRKAGCLFLTILVNFVLNWQKNIQFLTILNQIASKNSDFEYFVAFSENLSYKISFLTSKVTWKFQSHFIWQTSNKDEFLTFFFLKKFWSKIYLISGTFGCNLDKIWFFKGTKKIHLKLFPLKRLPRSTNLTFLSQLLPAASKKH